MTPRTLIDAIGFPLSKAEEWLSQLEEAMDRYGIDTPLRQAAFLAQIGHESGHLRYVKELWGPTPEPRKRLADPP